MKKSIFFLFTILLITTLLSCTERNESNIKEVGQDVIIYKQLDKTYNYDDVTNYLDQYPDMYSFFNEFSVKQYKSEDSAYYTVLQTNEGLVLIHFLKDGMLDSILQTNKDLALIPLEKDSILNFIEIITFSDAQHEKAISSLQIGSPLTDVMEADPNGQYPFIGKSWSGYPKISSHYFESGNCYEISYDDNHIISDITHYTI